MSSDFRLPMTDASGCCNGLMSASGGDWAKKAGKRFKKSASPCLPCRAVMTHGVTRITFEPESSNKKIPAVFALVNMGGAFAHLVNPEYAARAADVQAEVDRRWKRLKAMAADAEL